MMAEFPSEPSADPGSNLGIFFEGVDESTRQSQRLDCFDVFVEIEPGVATVELDVGICQIRNTQSKIVGVRCTTDNRRSESAANTKPLDQHHSSPSVISRPDRVAKIL
jgi:hypothetical protein